MSGTAMMSRQPQERQLGREAEMHPRPDYVPRFPGSGRLAGKVAQHGASAPMGRPGQPNEVAPCHLLLACADSSYMNGQVLHPNGGTVVGS